MDHLFLISIQTSYKHIENVQRQQSAQAPLDDEPMQELNITGQIIMARILLLCFLAEHNLALSTADHMCDLFKRMFPDSNIAKGLHMKRTTATEQAHKFSSFITDGLVVRLKQNKFSLIIDETTDTSKIKSLAIIAKFYDEHDGDIKTRMLDLIDLYDDNNNDIGSTGLAIFNKIFETLSTFHIPFDNFIGFAADTTSNMFGQFNSVASRLRDNFPGLTLFKCSCHSLHLCASEAAKTLPRMCEELVRGTYVFFSHSAKRRYEFDKFKDFYEEEPLSLLHPSQTRWLSLYMAVKRILHHWDALKEFFIRLNENEKLQHIEQLACMFQDKSIFIYLNFMEFILKKITSLNLLFQKDQATIHEVYFQITTFYRTSVQYFCSRQQMARLHLADFDHNDKANHLNVENIYLGTTVESLLQHMELHDREMSQNVKRRCRDFLQVLCTEIKKRFDFKDPILYYVSFFYPNKVLKPSTRDPHNLPSLLPLLNLLPRIYKGNAQDLDDEWRYLDSIPLPDDFKCMESGIVPFYQKLACFQEGDHFYFKKLSNFALQMLSLPVSNADAERLFSKLHLIKTDIRNRLSIKTVKSLIYISEAVKEQEACYLFEPTAEMINYFK